MSSLCGAQLAAYMLTTSQLVQPVCLAPLTACISVSLLA